MAGRDAVHPGCARLEQTWQQMLGPATDAGEDERQPLLASVEARRKHSATADRSSGKAASTKLGTFAGCFVPTTLNVISILLFLRFTFIVGQAGFVGSLCMLLVSYTVNLLSTLSISAICSNGVVRKGGAYYAISRTLGPEFGGSIGIMFYLGQILNTGMNVSGFVEPLLRNFGRELGEQYNLLPDGYWWSLFYSTLLLVLCTTVACFGSRVFSRASNILLVVLTISCLSIPLSALVRSEFELAPGLHYTGPSWATLKENMWLHLTKGAAGSESGKKETISSVFGVFYPATAGYFAGSSMSGDMRNPSRSIPRGTLYSLLATFMLYFVVIVSISASIPRKVLYIDPDALQNVSQAPFLVLIGALSSALFSSIMGIVGAAKLLEAIGKDDLIPSLSMFSVQSKLTGEPVRAMIFSHLLVQISIFGDINLLGAMITMTFLVTFLTANLACFCLRATSAPNFRPTFRFFSWSSTLAGMLLCLAVMFFVDSVYASAATLLTFVLFVFIHYTCGPGSQKWGDITQSLLYHQLRKYLLRLDYRKEHVKYWRPQILLLVHDPLRSQKLISFCNSLKKGSLYILGSVVVQHGEFDQALEKVHERQELFQTSIDITHIKAFVDVTMAPSLVLGARNLLLQSGLGSMRPNIVVMGFPDRLSQEVDGMPNDLSNVPTTGEHPADREPGICDWMQILEDSLAGSFSVMIAKAFPSLVLPESEQGKLEQTGLFGLSGENGSVLEEHEHPRCIDLWPIQLSSSEREDDSIMTINVDTYTMILQCGYILHTVPAWRKHRLRVLIFVEHTSQVADERSRLRELLQRLRISAETIVIALDAPQHAIYHTLVRGSPVARAHVQRVLGDAMCAQIEHQRVGAATARTYSTAADIPERPSAVTFDAPVPSGSPRSRRRSVSFVAPLSRPLSMRLIPVLPVLDDSDSSDSETETPATKAQDPEPMWTTAQRSESPVPMDGPAEPQKVPLSFDVLPPRAQYMILNEIMQLNSGSDDTAVSLTTLPPPSRQCWKSHEQSADWIRDMNILSHDVGAVAFVHSRSLTVTTNL